MDFDFNGHKIAVLGTNDNPLFHGGQVCKALGYSDPWDALKKVPESDTAVHRFQNTRGQLRPTIFVNEPGLYRLIFGSQLPSAEKFKTWVFRTVIPTYRKILASGQLTQGTTRRPYSPQYLKEVQDAINASGLLRGRVYDDIYKAQGVGQSIRAGLTQKPRAWGGYRYYDENGKYVKALHQRLSDLGLDDNMLHQRDIVIAYEMADGDPVMLRKFLNRIGINAMAITEN